MIAESLCFGQGLFQFLLDEDVDFIEIFEESFIQVLLEVLYMIEKTLHKSIQADHACEYSTNPEVLTGDIKEARVQIFHFEYIINLKKGYLNNFLICQFFLNIKEVIKKLTNIPNCM